VGTSEESSSHELRQTFQIYSPILQERDHAENRKVSEIGVPILSSLRPLRSPDRFQINPVAKFISVSHSVAAVLCSVLG